MRKRPFRFEDGQLVPQDDAKSNVYLTTISRDIVKGKRGHPRECVISNNGNRQHNQFPHKVYAVETHRSRCWIVDRLGPNDEFAHCVRYILDPSTTDKIVRFDKTGIWVPGAVTLHAPTHSNRSGVKHKKRNGGGNGPFKKHRKPALTRRQMALMGL